MHISRHTVNICVGISSVIESFNFSTEKGEGIGDTEQGSCSAAVTMLRNKMKPIEKAGKIGESLFPPNTTLSNSESATTGDFYDDCYSAK